MLMLCVVINAMYLVDDQCYQILRIISYFVIGKLSFLVLLYYHSVIHFKYCFCDLVLLFKKSIK